MQKSTLLLGLLMTACAVPSSSSTSNLATPWEGDAGVELDGVVSPGDGPVVPPDAPGPSCVIDGVTVFLDTLPANLDHSDGKVSFCHATSSPTNPFVLITTSVNACFAHTMHVHLDQGGHLDVFPTGGCAD